MNLFTQTHRLHYVIQIKHILIYNTQHRIHKYVSDRQGELHNHIYNVVCRKKNKKTKESSNNECKWFFLKIKINSKK